MMALLLTAGLVTMVFFGIQFFSTYMILSVAPQKLKKTSAWPKVSILLAARNEEELILRNLEAMSLLDYPISDLEILIGDDDSTDQTASIIKDHIQDKPQFKYFKITDIKGKARGKANVLAHLAHEASGEFFFITDVDVEVPKGWVKSLISAFDEGTGIVSGTTMCERGSLFATMQSIDWLHFMGYIKAFANAGVSCTSVGNNMAVRAEAYWQTGGFEEMEFSITEDYRLFESVTKNGWGWANILSEDSLGKAWYIPALKEMLHQRKRWLIGARDLPWNWKSMLILYGLFAPALIIILAINFKLGLMVWGMKFAMQTVFIGILASRAGEKPFKLFQYIAYEGYVMFNTIATAIFYLSPVKSVWKGRTYRSDNLA